MFFKGIKYDEQGRFLLLHHMGARKYIIMNFTILSLFFGISLYNYVKNPQVFFGKELLGKTYLILIGSTILTMWVFGNRQIRCLYLL